MDDIDFKLKDDKLETLEKFLRPTTYVCWLLGVGVSRPLNCSKISTIILRLIHFVLCSVIVAYGALDFFTFGSIFKSDTFKIMYYSNKVACYISSYYYVFHGFLHYKKWPMFVKKMASIDRKIKRFSLQRNGHGKFKIFQLSTIFVTILLGPISLVSHGVYYYFIRPEDIFASDLLLYYTIAQSLSVNFAFDLLVFAVYRRFNAINRSIERIDGNFTPSLIIHEIRRIRELHHAVCEIVRFLNGIYGVHLLMSSVNSFTMVTATLFRIYMGVVEKNSNFVMINNVIWIIYAAQFALTCCVCTKASRESSKAGALVHELLLSRVPKARSFCDLYAFDVERLTDESKISLRDEINDFSSQLQQSEVDFTACDFFSMNNALLRSFIEVITTYLIILVQFYQPETREPIISSTTLQPEAISV